MKTVPGHDRFRSAFGIPSFSEVDGTSYAEKVKRVIQAVPRGSVATYGQVATLAGSPFAARQVVWVLHSCSKRDNLPWQRIVNAGGRIALKPGAGHEQQKKLLRAEGIRFDRRGRIDLDRYLWEPTVPPEQIHIQKMMKTRSGRKK
jgi:methylated-DNA-protein-cysteine methyltransferase related protein